MTVIFEKDTVRYIDWKRFTASDLRVIRVLLETVIT